MNDDEKPPSPFGSFSTTTVKSASTVSIQLQGGKGVFGSSPRDQLGKTVITINGKTYNSLEELPPEVREVYEKAMGFLDSNNDGVIDFLAPLSGRPGEPADPSGAGSKGIPAAFQRPDHLRRDASFEKIRLFGSGIVFVILAALGYLFLR